jgi:isoleucyl-tRNA synthetase
LKKTRSKTSGNDGRKMSKSFGNYTDPNELMDTYSADSLRFLLLSSPLLNGEDFSLLDKDVADVARKLSMIWNMYDFFTLYADVDGWDWDGNLDDPGPYLTNVLDRWVVSRVHQLNKEVDEHMQRYDLPNAMKPILLFLDDASNWYVRRSRKRFWKSDNDMDKNDAYRTLHYVLLQLSMIMAPFTPFLSEELYRKLTDGESVHLLDWPKAGAIDTELVQNMALVRDVISNGLNQRAAHGIKVRQPLQSITIQTEHEKRLNYFKDIIAEELNIKEVLFEANDTNLREVISTEITPELKREGLMREVIRQVQNARKEADLQVDDRIRLHLRTEDSQLQQAIDEHTATIQAETLAVDMALKEPQGFQTEVTIEDIQLVIAFVKAQ